MEATVVNTLAAACTLWLMARALWHLVWRPYTASRWFERQGIRGPPYRFILGSMWDIKRMLVAGRAEAPLPPAATTTPASSIPSFTNGHPILRKNISYWLGPLPSICTTDMEIVKQVLEDRTDLFQKDYLNPSLEVILGDGIVFSNGDDWKRRRKVVYPIFYKESLKSVSAMTSEGTRKMMDEWCANIENGDGHQAEIDVRCCSEELTLGIIERVIFGKDYKESREVFIAGKELQKLAVYAFTDPPVPGFRYMPTRRNFRTWKLNKLITRKIMQLIKARLASGVYGDDLLGLMLQACRSEEVGLLSTQEIIGECKNFFASGQDTGANLLTWATFLLSIYPHWQENLREEVRRECQDDGGSEAPSMDVLGKLKLLNMFLLEILRLYSPVPFLLRKTASDTRLAGITVPKGTMVTFPIMMLHRSKEVWGLDADEFNPMRFENGVSRATKHPHAFLTFSCGPRVCAGKNYAVIEVQTVMAMILKKFSFSLSSNYVHMPTNFITVVPRYGLPLIVKKL